MPGMSGRFLVVNSVTTGLAGPAVAAWWEAAWAGEASNAPAAIRGSANFAILDMACPWLKGDRSIVEARQARRLEALERLEEGDFYILCPDNDVNRALDEKRIAWAAGDIIENRPPLSRWHPDYADAFKTYLSIPRG